MNRYLAHQKVVELKSFTKAAAALGYTQSSMSQMISALENEVGFKLLNRSRSGVQLTIEGTELYPYIEQAIYRYQAVQEKSKEIQGLETGTVHMGIFSSFAAHWIPTLLKEMESMYPKLEFIVREGNYSAIHDWIKTGAVDFGLLSPKAAPGLETTVLRTGRLLAALPVDHPLAALEVVPLRALAGEAFILPDEGLYSDALEGLRSVGITPWIKHLLQDDYAIMSMVEYGMGVSILAELATHNTHHHIAIRPIDPPINRTIAVAYRDKASLSIASQRFIAHLQKRAPDLP